MVGSGAREHALAQTLSRSAEVVVTPGNPGIARTAKAQCVTLPVGGLRLIDASGGKIDKAERVVVISTAHGLKFVEMKVKYHQRELDFPCRHVNQPIELPARLDAVKEALQKALAERSRFDL